MFDEDKVLLGAAILLAVDGDFYFSFEHEEEVLQVGMDMFGTAVAGFELEDGDLSDAASTLVSGEEDAFESHLVGRR